MTMIERLVAMSSGHHGLGAGLPVPEATRVEAAIARLRQAIAAARAGDHQRGRELCASVLFEVQPMLAQHRGLLRTAVCALLVSQGFRLLTRVAVALSGQRIRVVLWPGNTDRIARPQCQNQAQETIFTIDPRWLTQLSVEDPFIQGWCDSLARGQASYAGTPVANRARLSPEHV